MEGQYGTMGGSMGYDIEGIRPPSDKSLLRRGDMEPEDYEEGNRVNMCAGLPSASNGFKWLHGSPGTGVAALGLIGWVTKAV